MRRKKDDKRVLFSPQNNRRNRSKKRKISIPNRSDLNLPNIVNRPKKQRNPSKWGNATVFLIILALVAFVVGAGIGVLLSLDDGDDGPHWQNVTDEMTTNLNDTDNVTYDKELDNVDFNNNQTLTELNVTVEPSY